MYVTERSCSFLQIQRKLQLQIEEQARCLQMMFEKQRQMEDDKSKASSSALCDATSLVKEQQPLENNISEANKAGHQTSNISITAEANSDSKSKKTKNACTGSSDDLDSGDGKPREQPSKRVRTQEKTES